MIIEIGNFAVGDDDGPNKSIYHKGDLIGQVSVYDSKDGTVLLELFREKSYFLTTCTNAENVLRANYV
jgi:hypothetical protein